MKIKVDMKDMVHIFGDTYVPKHWIEELKAENVMSQNRAIFILDKLVFHWQDATEEYMIYDDEVDWQEINLNDSEYSDILISGLDMSGSPGHHEQFILNLLAISYPVVPISIINQVTHAPLRPAIESRKHGISIKMHENGTRTVTFQGKKEI